MKLAFPVLIAALLAGCATSSQTYTADGRIGYSINCSGTALNWGMCEQKAGDLCGTRGYEILSTAGDHGLIATGGNGNFFASSTISRSMLIACK
jgi:hypothetical protein